MCLTIRLFIFLALVNLLQGQQGQQQTGAFTTIMPGGGPRPTGVVSPWFNSDRLGGPQRPAVKTDCAVDGYVVNAITGEPIPRAQVMLAGMGGQNGVSADNSGRWTFTNISCGQISVMASRPGFIQGNFGQPRLGVASRPISLDSGSPVHDVKIQLTPQAVVTGKVVDEQGDPLMNVQVSALTSRVVEGRRNFQQNNGAMTNDLGEFRLANLQAGKYIICARGNAGASPFGGPVPLGESCYPGPLEAGPASAMDLGAGRDTRVDFTLRQVPVVHVRGMITGMPKNQGVGITLVKRGMNGGMGGAHPARIDPEGKFDVAGVTAGSYMLSTDYYEAGKRLTARVPVDVGSSDMDGIQVHLEPGFTVTGTVRMESKSGKTPPFQPFGINLRSTEPMFGGGQFQWNKDSSTFSVNELTAGSYRLDAFPQGGFYVKSATLGGRDISREEIPITQAAGPIEVILSDDGGTLEVQVTGTDDQPITSWVMLLQDGRPPRNFMAGADGHGKFAGLAPGDYKVFAWDDVQQVEYANPDWMRRFASGGVPVTVSAGQSVQVAVKQQIAPPQ